MRNSSVPNNEDEKVKCKKFFPKMEQIDTGTGLGKIGNF